MTENSLRIRAVELIRGNGIKNSNFEDDCIRIICLWNGKEKNVFISKKYIKDCLVNKDVQDIINGEDSAKKEDEQLYKTIVKEQKIKELQSNVLQRKKRIITV